MTRTIRCGECGARCEKVEGKPLLVRCTRCRTIGALWYCGCVGVVQEKDGRCATCGGVRVVSVTVSGVAT